MVPRGLFFSKASFLLRQARADARQEKDFARADAIREELTSLAPREKDHCFEVGFNVATQLAVGQNQRYDFGVGAPPIFV